MKSCRDKILDQIRRSQISSVPELSRSLGVSKTAVQYHIQHLLDRGEIQPAYRERSLARNGRPIRYYQIAADRQPDNINKLADALLTRLFSERDPVRLGENLRAAAEVLAGDVSVIQPFIKRMDQAMNRLTEYHYKPHWEVIQTGSSIHLRSCPYAAQLPAHPQLCNLDQMLLETMLGVPVQMKCRRAGNAGECVFVFSL